MEAWVLDLPGCRAVAGSMEALEPLIPVAINEYLSWLDRHKALPPNAYPVDYEIVEDISPLGSGCSRRRRSDQPRGAGIGAERVTFAHEDLMLATGR